VRWASERADHLHYSFKARNKAGRESIHVRARDEIVRQTHDPAGDPHIRSLKILLLSEFFQIFAAYHTARDDAEASDCDKSSGYVLAELFPL